MNVDVKKSVLASKSDKELEEYLKDGNRFVPKSIEYALEILKSRGKNFTDEEVERIMRMISKKNEIEDVVIHENHLKAAKLIYLYAGLACINLILNFQLFNSLLAIIISLVLLAFIVGTGYLISRGYDWIKYILPIFIIIGVIEIPVILFKISNYEIIGIIHLIQVILLFYTAVLLFKIHK